MKKALESNTSYKPAVGILLPHPNLSRVVAEMLTREGFSAKRFLNTQELMKALQNEPPEALIMDMDMDNAQEISKRARIARPHLAVLMISTLSERQHPDERTSVHPMYTSWRDMISELRQMLTDGKTSPGFKRE